MRRFGSHINSESVACTSPGLREGAVTVEVGGVLGRIGDGAAKPAAKKAEAPKPAPKKEEPAAKPATKLSCVRSIASPSSPTLARIRRKTGAL